LQAPQASPQPQLVPQVVQPVGPQFTGTIVSTQLGVQVEQVVGQAGAHVVHVGVQVVHGQAFGQHGSQAGVGQQGLHGDSQTSIGTFRQTFTQTVSGTQTGICFVTQHGTHSVTVYGTRHLT
jgi:hypothetical protein